MAGIEADIQLSTQNATPTFNCPGAVCNPAIVGVDAPVTASFDRAQKLDWFGTCAAASAHATPDAMIYVTGGLAVGEIKTSGTVSGFSSGVGCRRQPYRHPGGPQLLRPHDEGGLDRRRGR